MVSVIHSYPDLDTLLQEKPSISFASSSLHGEAELTPQPRRSKKIEEDQEATLFHALIVIDLPLNPLPSLKRCTEVIILKRVLVSV